MSIDQSETFVKTGPYKEDVRKAKMADESNEQGEEPGD